MGSPSASRSRRTKTKGWPTLMASALARMVEAATMRFSSTLLEATMPRSRMSSVKPIKGPSSALALGSAT